MTQRRSWKVNGMNAHDADKEKLIISQTIPRLRNVVSFKTGGVLLEGKHLTGL